MAKWADRVHGKSTFYREFGHCTSRGPKRRSTINMRHPTSWRLWLSQPADEGPAHVLLKISVQAALIRRRPRQSCQPYASLAPTRLLLFCPLCRPTGAVVVMTGSRGTSRKRSSARPANKTSYTNTAATHGTPPTACNYFYPDIRSLHTTKTPVPFQQTKAVCM